MKDQVLFLDLETTNLNPTYSSILEVAAIVVDSDLQQGATFERVIYHDIQHAVNEMDDFVRNMHSSSGLIDEVARSPFDLRQTDADLAQFISKHFTDGKKVELAGNSVHFDLAFIKHHMPRTAGLLSHQLQDVSGAARMANRFLGLSVPKPEGVIAHRAMADCQHSIKQLLLIRDALRGAVQFAFETGKYR